jgi:nitrite reductase/ring-hydroxylating ferredoxin subunit
MMIRLCRISELRDGVPTAVTSGKYAFTVIKDGDRVYVTQAVCPHGRWLFAVGTYSNGILVCRGHNMVVNLEKGIGELRGATYRVRVYRHHVKDGELYVETQ